MKGNEADCICEKPNGEHGKHCNAYRLRQFGLKVASVTGVLQNSGGNMRDASSLPPAPATMKKDIHIGKEEEICGKLIHVGFEGNTTCGNKKKGCILHDKPSECICHCHITPKPTWHVVCRCDAHCQKKWDELHPSPREPISGDREKARMIVNQIAAFEVELRRMGFSSQFLEAIENDIASALSRAKEEGYDKERMEASELGMSLRVGYFNEGRRKALEEAIAAVEKIPNKGLLHTTDVIRILRTLQEGEGKT